jgi:type I restriction enzyme S subunit
LHDFAVESGVPEGWACQPLRDLIAIHYGKAMKESDRKPGDVPVYGSGGLVGRHSTALTPAQAIVIGRKGSVGSVFFSPRPCWPIDTTYFITDFGPFEPPFLYHALKSLDLAHLDTSSAIPGLNRDDLYAQDIPVPPQAEQQRIVAKVEALLARVNAARQRLAKAPAILKRFRQSVLAAACSGRLTADWRERNSNSETAAALLGRLTAGRIVLSPAIDESPELPDSWTWANPHGVTTDIVDCPHSTPRWAESGHLCLRTTNFRPGLLDLSEVRYVSDDTYRERVARLRPQPGDIVYSREGGILGIACIIPLGINACLGQRMMLFRVHPACSPEYFMHVLNSPLTTKRVQELTGGTASPHLNVGDIKEFPVPLPPTPEQHEIGRRVEALFKLADVTEKRAAAAMARADKLTQAILAKAFRGQLVSTEAELARREGRDYEPAAALLARIKAEKQAEPRKPARRSRKIDPAQFHAER